MGGNRGALPDDLAPELDALSVLQWQSMIRLLDLPSMVKLVALVLAGHADGKTGENAYPSQATLARECGISVSTVYRALRDLRGHYLIVRTRSGSSLGTKSSDAYRLMRPVDLFDRVQPNHR